MADVTKPTNEFSAEKAYAEAVNAAPVEFPSKVKRVPKTRPAIAAPSGRDEPVIAPPPADEVVIEPVQPDVVVVAQAPSIEPASALPAIRKPPVSPAVKAKRVKPARPLPVAAKKAAIAKKKTAPKSATPKIQTAPKPTPIAQLKDKLMPTKKTNDFTASVKGVVADVQTKAKLAYAKGTAAFDEAQEFTKGNVGAFVESGKILATGLQGLGKNYAAETKTAFETVTGDVKQIAAVKSPADFFRLQSEILHRNLETAFALGSKNSEAVLKLADAAFAPISGRVSLAVDKFKKAA